MTPAHRLTGQRPRLERQDKSEIRRAGIKIRERKRIIIEGFTKLQPRGRDPGRIATREIASRKCWQSFAAPVRQIAENAGTDGAVVAGKLVDAKDVNLGYDAQNGTYVDMIKAGIIDPTKVVRTALQDAASVAALLITTEAMIAERPEKKSAPMGGGDMGGMGGMGGMDF